MYHNLLLIHPTEAIDVVSAHARFEQQQSWYSAISAITCDEATITLRWITYSMRVSLEKEPWVAIKSAEIADRDAQDHPDKAIIVQRTTLVTIRGDDDPTMQHFNDYSFAQEAIESLYRDPTDTSISFSN